MFKFYIACYVAKFIMFCIKLLKSLKIIKANASFFPGKVAIKIDKDFLKKIAKPDKIIAVTGTNGKTTVCNLLIGILESSGKKVLDNRLGANIDAGVASAFIAGTTIFNKTKYDVGILEVDERSSIKVYSYITPTYLVCTNLFRDSIRRNAHPEFILSIINKALPKETKLVLNADDLISSSLGSENERVYFAIDKLDTDRTESINIINDMRVCPKCNTKLEYNYVRYHHIGNAYCPKCGFKSPKADYKAVNVIAVLTEIGLTYEQIQSALEKEKIVESRYSEESINGIKIVNHLAKGQNPIACSCVFDYIRHEKGNKELVLLLYDKFDAKSSSESMPWLYDCDFEFLNDDSIQKIIIGGPRAEDFYLRLLIAGVPKEKLIFVDNAEKTSEYVSLAEDIYILYDVYDEDIAMNVKKNIKERIVGGGK